MINRGSTPHQIEEFFITQLMEKAKKSYNLLSDFVENAAFGGCFVVQERFTAISSQLESEGLRCLRTLQDKQFPRIPDDTLQDFLATHKRDYWIDEALINAIKCRFIETYERVLEHLDRLGDHTPPELMQWNRVPDILVAKQLKGDNLPSSDESTRREFASQNRPSGETASSDALASAFTHSPDYRSVTLRGQSHSLTASQAAVIRVLHECSASGNPSVGYQHILEEIDSTSKRLYDLFRSNRLAWDCLIGRGATRGTFKLNL